MRRIQQKPCALTEESKNKLRALGADLRRVWAAPPQQPRSQGTVARPSGGSDCYCRSSRTKCSSNSALARRHAHRSRSLPAAFSAARCPHRRRYGLPSSPPRRSLYRRCYRQYLESSGSRDGDWRTIHGQSVRKPAPLSNIPGFSRRLNNPLANWRPFDKPRRSWVSTLPLCTGGSMMVS